MPLNEEKIQLVQRQNISTDAFVIEDDGGAECIRVNNSGITTFFKVPTLDNTPTTGHNSTIGTHGFSVQRSFARSITAGNVANFCDYTAVSYTHLTLPTKRVV